MRGQICREAKEHHDGSYCRVSAEGEPYSGTIGGVNEFDCFDGLFYAG